ncbi:MAG: YggU family protein [Dehalococcoidales bacterium]|nr:YggU family protein [Dehalococcoidales bacterium]
MTANSHSKSNWLPLRVTPNASRNEITGFIDEVLQVKICAPPVKGKANRELIAFLSRALGVKRSSLSIVNSQASRSKVIAVEGLTRDDILKRILT